MVNIERLSPIAQMLRKLGADGLRNDSNGCDCGLDNLSPHDCFDGFCEPAYEVKCLGPKECGACEDSGNDRRCFYQINEHSPSYKMKPCLKCGAPSEEVHTLADYITSNLYCHWGHCQKCGFKGPIRSSLIKAIDAWNA